jgi:SPP1 family predicted phage head-tail adaptor
MAGYFTRAYEHWRKTETPDGAGGLIVEWNQIGTLRGRAYPASMTDDVVAARRVGKVTWTFATAGDADLRVNDEIRFDGRTLKVEAVGETSTGRRLEATCEETQP